MDLTGKELITTMGSYDLYRTDVTDLLNDEAPKGFTVYFLTEANQPTEMGLYVIYDHLSRPVYESTDPNFVQGELKALGRLKDMGT
jgi:hypothetical protein